MIEKDEIAEGERAVLLGVVDKDHTQEQVEDYMSELAFLAQTAGAESVKQFYQKLPMPDAKTYFGQGKIEAVLAFVKANNISMILFDDELTPSQMRNLEKIFNKKIIDRTGLILDIFAQRAQTAHAKKQVELAQYQYLLPRLTRLWTHLERQKGGIGMRGPGETEIETDRRIIRDKIAKLKKELTKIDKQKAIQRQNRGRLIRVALVGYTNAGKSTLMRTLSKAEVFAENKLFATLDTTVRKVVIGNLPFLLSDTVGFIRKLPHQLVESFKSTLDETVESDLILHLIDISHKNFEDHIKVVNETLNEIGAGDKPHILVFNKTDNYTYTPLDEDDLRIPTPENYSLEYQKRIWDEQFEKTAFISALQKEGIEDFKKMLYEEVKQIHITRFPYNDFLYNTYTEEEE